MVILKKRKEFHKDVENLINEASNFVAIGQLPDAHNCLDRALALDFDHSRVMDGLKYIKFWEERLQSLSQYQESNEHAEAILQYWKAFKKFIQDISIDPQLIQSFRHYIFSRLLNILSNMDFGNDEQEMQLWQGIAYKGRGNYDDAQKSFFKAMQSGSPRARILSELADTYALVGEDQEARVFFREAFYLDPQDNDIDGFESELFVRLTKQVQEKIGSDVDELREWMPVYGSLWGILNVKRELRAVEYGKLRQNIFKYEQELKDDIKSHIILPRLLNHYFWIIDYYVMNQENQYKIDDTLLKFAASHRKCISYIQTN